MGPFWKGSMPRTLVAAIAVLILISGGSFAYWHRIGRVVQPIQFNHRKHVAQIECSGCHTYFSEGARSGLPDANICGACHADAITKSPEEAKLRKMLEDGKPLIFHKLFHLPAHVYYSHRRHAILGKLECVRCHGKIAETEVPPTRPLVQISMKYCTQCHENSKVSTDCKSCHR